MNDNIRTQALLAVERCMQPGVKDLFLQRMTEVNPRLRGAHVADILDMMESSDAWLDVVEDSYYEPLYDTCEAAWGESDGQPGVGSLVASLALYALRGAHSSQGMPMREPVEYLALQAIKYLRETA